MDGWIIVVTHLFMLYYCSIVCSYYGVGKSEIETHISKTIIKIQYRVSPSFSTLPGAGSWKKKNKKNSIG